MTTSLHIQKDFIIINLKKMIIINKIMMMIFILITVTDIIYVYNIKKITPPNVHFIQILHILLLV